MIKKIGLMAISSVFVVSPFFVQAQSTSVMPTLYNQAGTAVNVNGGTLAAGYYYLGGGLSMGGHQIEYYGNGTFYDSSIQQYGGSIYDATGQAGVSLGYTSSMSSISPGFHMAIMPTIYNQAGVAVNTTNGTLAAGYYYLGNGFYSGTIQIQYYGNGTYYNPTTLQYGGSVTNSGGTAGVALGYSA